jgi:hypothetical protein
MIKPARDAQRCNRRVLPEYARPIVGHIDVSMGYVKEPVAFAHKLRDEANNCRPERREEQMRCLRVQARWN